MWPAFTETWCQRDPTPFWGWIWKLTLMLDLTEQIPAVGFKNVVARLNPEPEVIVIIFTIIMWVECLGVHTLLYIYGSSVSLSVPVSLSARLSLSLRPGRLPHFLPLLTEDQDPSLSPQKRMVSFFTAAKPLPLPGETRPEADYSKETVLTGPKCSWLWVWSVRQINSIELILA